MNRDLLVYFLVLLVPVCLLPVAAHRLLTQELDRGRILGTSFLQAKAEARAAAPDATGAVPAVTDPILVEIVDKAGQPRTTPFPDDGRCFGEAPLAGPAFPACRLRVAWAGTPSPGFARRRSLMRAEGVVWAFAGLFFLVGAGLLARAAIRARQAARRQLDWVDDFSHRLKTPLTSISLCAELAKSGRLPDGLDKEATETVAAETAKLTALVDEVLDYIGKQRHG